MDYSNRHEEPARVLIVDDSLAMRKWLRHVLEGDPRLCVIGEACNSVEARDAVTAMQIDVMTLDVNMPGISGLDFLRRLMVNHPMPVVMVSALTEKGSSAALEALSLGAVDCIAKPRQAPTPQQQDAIRQKVFAASRTRVQRGAAQRPGSALVQKGDHTSPNHAEEWRGKIILCGASTGGVAAIEIMLRELDNISAPIVIAQHMPEMFLHSFCRRLNETFSRQFKIAEDGLVLTNGMGVLALGKTVSTRIERRSSGRVVCRLGPPSETANYRPNVDDLFVSGAEQGCVGAGILLTGMGHDGASGLLKLRDSGAKTFAQDEESSVVFGMPGRAVELNAATHVLAPAQIGQKVAHLPDLSVQDRCVGGLR